METTEGRSGYLIRSETRSVIGTELRNFDSIEIKESIVKGMEETLAEAVEMGFNAVSTGVKHVIYSVHRVSFNQHGILWFNRRNGSDRFRTLDSIWRIHEWIIRQNVPPPQDNQTGDGYYKLRQLRYAQIFFDRGWNKIYSSISRNILIVEDNERRRYGRTRIQSSTYAINREEKE